jgi:hypothetical protein
MKMTKQFFGYSNNNKYKVYTLYEINKVPNGIRKHWRIPYKGKCYYCNNEAKYVIIWSTNNIPVYLLLCKNHFEK